MLPSLSLSCHLCCCFFSCVRRHTSCLSDWSSDVCSADLPSLVRMANTDTERERREREREAVAREMSRLRAAEDPDEAREIGRASCRERVWIAEGHVRRQKQRSRRRRAWSRIKEKRHARAK